MKKDYSTYNVNDFLIDKEFRKSVLRGNEGSREIWDSIIKPNPSKLMEIEEAKEIILKMEFGGEFELPKSKKDEIWSALNQELIDGEQFEEKHQEYLNYQPSNKRFFSSTFWRVAAAVLLLAISSLAYLHINTADGEMVPEYIVKSTRAGEKMTVVLPDKSTVKLNSGSRLVYPSYFAKDSRELYFEGEAFFEVTKDKSRPFRIKSTHIRTSVLGTSFILKSFPEKNISQVAVLTGKVGVQPIEENDGHNKDEPTIVLPNEMVKYDAKMRVLNKNRFDYLEEIAWKDGILYFRNADLNEIIQRLERWFGVDVVVRNKDRIKISYNGTFQNSSLEQVLDGIRLSSNFTYEIMQGNKIILIGN